MNSILPTKPNRKPQIFEVALVRRLEQRNKSVRDAFLSLDADGDGRISAADFRTTLHNELGIDITKEQEDLIFQCPITGNGQKKICPAGMTYAEFSKYFENVSAAGASLPASQSGLAAAVGFQSNAVDNVEHKIEVSKEKQRYLMRKSLKRQLSAHSPSDMKATSLFLAMDVHLSGKVTVDEFMKWTTSMGLEMTKEDSKVVFGDDLWKKCFVDRFGKEEAGMTEHEFAEFIISLDEDREGGGGKRAW